MLCFFWTPTGWDRKVMTMTITTARTRKTMSITTFLRAMMRIQQLTIIQLLMLWRLFLLLALPQHHEDFVLTPRPSIGKKRAKVLAQQAVAIKLKKKKEPAAADVPSVNQLLKHRQNESLEHLALASEAKANVARSSICSTSIWSSWRPLLWLLSLRRSSLSMPLLLFPSLLFRQLLLPNVINVDEPAAHDDSNHEDPDENSDDDDNGSYALDTDGPPGIDTSTTENSNEESHWENSHQRSALSRRSTMPLWRTARLQHWWSSPELVTRYFNYTF